jgi:hypothetical protein
MMTAKISRLCLRLVLVLALLMAEWHTFAHAVEHKLHPDDRASCFICITADHLSHNVPASHTGLLLSIHSNPITHPFSQAFWDETVAFFYARGPPVVRPF